MSRDAPNHVNATGGIRNAVENLIPALAVIIGHKDVDSIVIAAMAIERYKRRSLRGFRCHHAADVRALRHAGNARSHILPILSPIARHLQVPIIGAYPQYVWSQG